MDLIHATDQRNALRMSPGPSPWPPLDEGKLDLRLQQQTLSRLPILCAYGVVINLTILLIVLINRLFPLTEVTTWIWAVGAAVSGLCGWRAFNQSLSPSRANLLSLLILALPAIQSFGVLPAAHSSLSVALCGLGMVTASITLTHSRSFIASMALLTVTGIATLLIKNDTGTLFAEATVLSALGLSIPLHRHCRLYAERLAGFEINHDLSRREMEDAIFGALFREEQLRFLSEKADCGWFLHEKGKVIDCNEVLARWLGKKSEELIHSPVQEFLSANFLKKGIPADLSSLSRMELQAFPTHGNPISIECISRWLPYKDEHLLLTVCRNLTNVRNLRLKMDELEKRSSRFRERQIGIANLETKTRRSAQPLDLFQPLLQLAVEHLPVHGGAGLLMHDPAYKTWIVSASTDPRWQPNELIEPDPEIMEHLIHFIKHGETWKIEAHNVNNAAFLRLLPGNPSSCVLTPFIVHDNIQGVLIAWDEEERAFPPDEVFFMEALTRQAGAILDRNQLLHAQNSQMQRLWKAESDLLAENQKRAETELQRKTTERQLKVFQDEIGSLRSQLEEKEAVVKESIGMMQKATESQLEFIHSLVHELNPPVDRILVETKRLLYSGLEEPARRLTESIREQAGQMQTIMRNMTDLHPVEVSTREEPVSAFSLITAGEINVHQRAPEAFCKGLDLFLDPSNTPEGLFRGHLGKICQAMDELLQYAIHASPQGRVRLRIFPCAQPKEDAHRTWICFAIQGNDPEIPTNRMKNLITAEGELVLPNTKASDSAFSRLSLVRNLAHSMKGNLKGESQDGQGTTFTLELPLEVVSTTEDLWSPLLPNHLSQAQLLLVSEDRWHSSALEAYLKRWELPVTTAENEIRALQLCQNTEDPKRFPLLILDTSPAERDPLEIPRLIKNNGSIQVPPILLLVPESLRHIGTRAMEQSMVEHVFTKPILAREFKACLSQLLQSYWPHASEGLDHRR